MPDGDGATEINRAKQAALRTVEQGKSSLDAMSQTLQDGAQRSISAAAGTAEDALGVLSDRIKAQPLLAGLMAVGVGFGLAMLLRSRA